MVKSNLSVGGKILTILLSFIFFIVAIAGGLYAVVKTVKVRQILGLFGGENWVAEDYDDTILEFVKTVSTTLSGEITVNKLAEISPELKNKADGIIDNVEQNDLFMLDRETLYKTPVDQLSSTFQDILVLTASLNQLTEKFGAQLPNLAFIQGDEVNPLDIYTKVTNDEGVIDKAFTYPETRGSAPVTYTYYTRADAFFDNVPESADKIVTLQPRNVYTLTDLAVNHEMITYHGGKLYLRKQSATTAEYSYSPLTAKSETVQNFDGSTAQFWLHEGEDLFVADVPTAESPDGYRKVTPAAADKTVSVPEVALPCRHQDLYAALDAKPAGESIEIDGKFYVLATQYNEATGEYIVLDAYRGLPLYRKDYKYTAVTDVAQPSAQPLYVKSNGIGSLPVIFGMNALSEVIDINTLTMDKMTRYFGIDMSAENPVLDTVRYIPVNKLNSSFKTELNNIHIGDIITVDASSSPILKFLADFSVGDLDSAVHTCTIGNIINVDADSHSLIKAIQNWTLDDISDPARLDSLTLGDVIKVDSSSPRILQHLAGNSIQEIGATIDKTALGDIMEIGEDDTVLSNLRNSTLLSLPSDLQTLSVQKMFANDIYAYHTLTGKSSYAEYEALYGAKNLYVYNKGSYTQATASAPVAELCSPYLFIGTTVPEEYKNIPLYARSGDKFVSATEAGSYKLKDSDKTALEGKRLFKRFGDGTYEEIAMTESFAIPTVYYFDGPSEHAKSVALIPASLQVKAEFEGRNLFARQAFAQKASSATQYYHDGNLFFYNVTDSAWQQAALNHASDAKGKLFYADNTLVYLKDGKYYDHASDAPVTVTSATDLDAAYVLATEIADGTPLFTYGKVSGVWKYLLTNDGAEVTCNLQQITALVTNVQKNINALTINQLYKDGMMEISDEDAAQLSKEISPILAGPLGLPDGITIGDLRFNDMLRLTIKLLSM